MSMRQRLLDTVLLTILFPTLLCLFASVILVIEIVLLSWFCKVR
ncbi:MAG: hypothetical protein ACM359_22380 [Bacillota bacterium]